jgi:tetratricopeptide (TPR) repeat protein
MRRLAYALVFLVVIGLFAGGVLVMPGRHRGANLLVQAAYAMGASDTLHVRGDRNLADEYSPWSSEPGSYEFWFSPDGFRQDWYDKDGALARSLGGTVPTGQAWQYFPDQSSGKRSLFTYRLSPDELSAYIKVNRERFANGQLRVAEIAERGHAWTESAGEWQGKPAAVVTEELTPTLVSGEQRGTIEYYLDRQTNSLVGMAHYGPAAEGRALRASVNLIEYNLEVPQDVFQSEAPSGATVRTGQYAVRPSGDIAFYPSDTTAMQSLLASAVEQAHNAQMGITPWEEAEKAYLSVLKEDPENAQAREYLGRMWTRWGLYQDALDILVPGDGHWSDLNRAFFLDALGRRQEAVALYEKLKDAGHDSVAEWAKLGLQRPTWPRDIDIRPQPGEFLLKPRSEWRASASSSSAETTPQAAIDGDPIGRWSNGGGSDGHGQSPGQWFQLDFGTRVNVSRVLMDCWGTKSYVNDWPRGLRATYTTDGSTWLPIDVSQAGPMRPATVRLDPPVIMRSIRFEITEPHDPEWWSIHEIYVFSPTG